MVPQNEGDVRKEKTMQGNQKLKQASRSDLNAEKDTEEYRKLRERNNEAVKKSRTRTKVRTQTTLEKVDKLRQENSSLEERIEGLKKELDLLKELFLSHAGTKSLKRLSEVDLEVLLAEAAPASKRKRGAAPYTGRSRELIEKEVRALLGQQQEDAPQDSTDEDRDDDDDDDDGDGDGELARPSTSQADQTDNSSCSMTESRSEEVNEEQQQQQQPIMEPIDEEQQHQHHDDDDQQTIIEESYAVSIDDSAENASIWATDTGESVVVTISDDGQTLVTTTGTGVQQDLAAIINGELLMLE